MEQSAHSKEILKLGEEIVKELKIYEGVDTLSKWMCHYIAELMHKAKTAESEGEKTAAERECCELILKIWKNREVKSPPTNLYPLSGMGDIIGILKELKEPDRFYRDILISLDTQIDSTNKWSKLVKQSIYTAKNTANLALLIAIAEQELNSKIDWTKDYVNLLSDEEKQLIELLEHFSFENRRVVFTEDDNRSLIDLTPEERNELIFNRFNKLIEKQKTIIESIKNLDEIEK